MKIRIKSFNGELPSYLSEGKKYIVLNSNAQRTRFNIECDDGEWAIVSLDFCSILNGGSWEIVSE